MPPPSPPHYLCQRCGNCCRWPGDVRLKQEEPGRIAQFLGMDVEDFIGNYCRVSANRTGLSLEEKENGECIFLEGVNTCRIQSAKPEQCRGFPNSWNFPGWQDICKAVAMPPPPQSEGQGPRMMCEPE